MRGFDLCWDMTAWRRRVGRYRCGRITAGFLGGVLASLLGFAAIYLRTGRSIQEGKLGAIGDLGSIGVGIKPPDAWQVVGWLYYAAHDVDIVVTVTGLGRSGSGTVPLTNGVLWERWFVLVPVVTLLAGGFVVASLAGAADVIEGFLAGGTVALGYGSVAVTGAILTTWDVVIAYGGMGMSGSIGPDPFGGMLLVGLAYPIVLGGLGGTLAVAVGPQ